jgi:hypothetical protein
VSCCGKYRQTARQISPYRTPANTPAPRARIWVRNDSRHTLALSLPGDRTYDFSPGQQREVAADDGEVLLRTGLFTLITES